MTNNQLIRYEMLLRVREFGEKHRDLFSAGSVGGQALEKIDEAVKQLSEQAVSKITLARHGIRSKTGARDQLARKMEMVSLTARAIGRVTIGFDAPFRMPRPRTDHSLLTGARGFVREAEGSQSRFVDYGMAPDFLTALAASADGFEVAVKHYEAGRDGRAFAHAAIETALSSAFEAVRAIEVIVANRFKNEPATLAVWQRDRKVDWTRRVRRVMTSSTPDPGEGVLVPATSVTPKPEPAAAGAAS